MTDEDHEQTIAALRADLGALRDNEVKMRRRIKELEAAAGSTDDLVARARAEAAAEREQQLLSAHHRELNEAEVRVRAARQFQDPDDAVRFLDLDKLGAKQGRIEAGALDEAMADLLRAKPYLASGGSAPAAPSPRGEESPPAESNGHRVQGDGGGGARPVAHSSPDAPMNEMIRKAAGR